MTDLTATGSVETDGDVDQLIRALRTHAGIREVGITFPVDYAPIDTMALMDVIFSMPSVHTVYLAHARLLPPPEDVDASTYVRREPHALRKVTFDECAISMRGLDYLSRGRCGITEIGTLVFHDCTSISRDQTLGREDVPLGTPAFSVQSAHLFRGGLLMAKLFVNWIGHFPVQHVDVSTTDKMSQWLAGARLEHTTSLVISLNGEAPRRGRGGLAGPVEPSLASVDFDNGPALAEAIATAPRLEALTLDFNGNYLSDTTAAAIGRIQLTDLSVVMCRVTPAQLAVMLAGKNQLRSLILHDNPLTSTACSVLLDAISVNYGLRDLDISNAQLSRECADRIAQAVLRSTAVTSFTINTRADATSDELDFFSAMDTDNDERINDHLRANEFRRSIDGRARVDMSMVCVLVSGSLQAEAIRRLGGNDALVSVDVETRILSGLCTAGIQFGAACKRRGDMAIAQRYEDERTSRAWWIERGRRPEPYGELVDVIRQTVEGTVASARGSNASRGANDEPLLVTYAVDADFRVDLPGAIRVMAVCPRELDNFLASAHATPAGSWPLVIACASPPTAAQMRRASALFPRWVIVQLGNLRGEVLRQRQSMSARVVDALYSLAILRDGQTYLPSGYLAHLASDYDEDARPDCPCILPLPDGGVITRLPTFLAELRRVFASRPELTRALPARRYTSSWFENNVLSMTDAVSVFQYAIDDPRVPAEEAVAVMTKFCCIFPVDARRAVYPKFANVPAVLYRMQARLLQYPGVNGATMRHNGIIDVKITHDSRVTFLTVSCAGCDMRIASDQGLSGQLAAALERFLR